jgi:hypothetical protein
MSDIVNEDDLSALAAEYVIGTLDPDERTRANVLIDVDQGFRDLVGVWERRLGELHLMVEPVEPDGRIWERIRGRLGIVSLPRAPSLPLVAEPKPEPKVEAKLELKLEPKLESGFGAKLGPESESKSEPKAEPSSEPDLSSKSAPEREPLTTEQQLAGLVLEAEKFSERRAAETAAEPSDAAAEAPVEAPANLSGEAGVEARAEARLDEAAEAIAPSEEPGEAEPAAPVEPAALREPAEALPRGLMPPVELSYDFARMREAERRGGAGWRVAALFMAFVAFGLGGLIAAWRLVPDRLPPPLQPAAVLGLTEASAPPERKPAPHGTQFEE